MLALPKYQSAGIRYAIHELLGRAGDDSPFDRTIDNLVASTQLYILRPNEQLLPRFLAWYLNQERAQAYFDAFARGSTIRSINKKILGELEIPVPPVEQQRVISDVVRLLEKENELSQQIQRKRRRLIEYVLFDAATPTRPAN